MDKLSDIRDYIPKNVWDAIKSLYDGERINEIRFRLMSPVLITVENRTFHLKDRHGNVVIGDKVVFDYIVNKLSGGSLYSVNENIKQGFVTLPGGHRVGVCGSAVCDEGGIRHIKNVSSLCFRVCREIVGCSEEIIEEVNCGSKVYNTLIASPPGCGKTTLLRDLCRVLGSGYAKCGIKCIGVADERSEIASINKGVACFDVGDATFICDGYAKTYAMNLMLRTMSPDVIVCDEIGSKEDFNAVRACLKCGVNIIATAHATDFNDLSDRFGEDIRCFEKIIFLKNRGEVFKVCRRSRGDY